MQCAVCSAELAPNATSCPTCGSAVASADFDPYSSDEAYSAVGETPTAVVPALLPPAAIVPPNVAAPPPAAPLAREAPSSTAVLGPATDEGNEPTAVLRGASAAASPPTAPAASAGLAAAAAEQLAVAATIGAVAADPWPTGEAPRPAPAAAVQPTTRDPLEGQSTARQILKWLGVIFVALTTMLAISLAAGPLLLIALLHDAGTHGGPPVATLALLGAAALYIVVRFVMTTSKNCLQLAKSDLGQAEELREIDVAHSHADEHDARLSAAMARVLDGESVGGRFQLVRAVGDPTFNAFALRTNTGSTIMVYDGLLMDTTDSELQSVLAHEVGHLVHRDSHVQAALNSFSMAVDPAARLGVMTGKSINKLTLAIANSLEGHRSGWGAWFALFLRLGVAMLNLVHWVMNGVAWVMLKIAGFAQMSAGRDMEFMADRFAARKAGLESTISLLQKISDSEGNKQRQRSVLYDVASTHPATEKRIAALRAAAAGQTPSLGLASLVVGLLAITSMAVIGYGIFVIYGGHAWSTYSPREPAGMAQVPASEASGGQGGNFRPSEVAAVPAERAGANQASNSSDRSRGGAAAILAPTAPTPEPGAPGQPSGAHPAIQGAAFGGTAPEPGVASTPQVGDAFVVGPELALPPGKPMLAPADGIALPALAELAELRAALQRGGVSSMAQLAQKPAAEINKLVGATYYHVPPDERSFLQIWAQVPETAPPSGWVVWYADGHLVGLVLRIPATAGSPEGIMAAAGRDADVADLIESEENRVPRKIWAIKDDVWALRLGRNTHTLLLAERNSYLHWRRLEQPVENADRLFAAADKALGDIPPRVAEAEDGYRKVLGLVPYYLRAKGRLAKAAYWSGRYDEAQKILDEAFPLVRNRDIRGDLLFYQGVLNLWRGDSETARGNFQEDLDLNKEAIQGPARLTGLQNRWDKSVLKIAVKEFRCATATLLPERPAQVAKEFPTTSAEDAQIRLQAMISAKEWAGYDAWIRKKCP